MTFHLAQANIARMLAPLDSPVMAGFVAQLDYMNAVAEQSPGFVWRLQTEEGDSTAIRAFDDPFILFNMSVWTDVQALYAYTYRSDHVGVFRTRLDWFSRLEGAPLVMWWVPEGHEPTIEEARAHFDTLNRDGPSPDAFTFKQAFDAAGAPMSARERAEWSHAGD